jgi:hypothetical protein
LKNNVDVALVNLGQYLSDTGIYHVNELATANEMAVTIGGNIFILGYPLGFSHFIDTPIWKRGSIASEPHLETPNTQNRIIVDATARKGMSGSPVIMRAATHYLSEDGRIKCHANATRLIGVFSSRPQFQAEEPTDTFAEIGYVYKSGCIYDIIVSGTPAPDYGMLP